MTVTATLSHASLVPSNGPNARRFSNGALPSWVTPQSNMPRQSSSIFRATSQPPLTTGSLMTAPNSATAGSLGPATAVTVPRTVGGQSYALAPTVPSIAPNSTAEISMRSIASKSAQKGRFCNFNGCMGRDGRDGSSQMSGSYSALSGTVSTSQVSSSAASSSYTSSSITDSIATPQQRAQLPVPKGRAAADAMKPTRAGSEASSSAWDLNSRYMKACRTGPTAWPAHIQTKNPEFSKTDPSPLLLYYYDETAPNPVLLANDVRGEHPFHHSKQQLKKLLTCQGGREEEYPVDGDEYSTNVPLSKALSADRLPVDEMSTSEGSDSQSESFSGSSTYSSSEYESGQPPKSGCCGTGRQLSAPTELSGSSLYSGTSFTEPSTDSRRHAALPSVTRRSTMRSASRPLIESQRTGMSARRQQSAHVSYTQSQQQQMRAGSSHRGSTRKSSVATSVSLAPAKTGCCGQQRGRPIVVSRDETNGLTSGALSSSVEEVVSKYSKRVSNNDYIVTALPPPSHLPSAYVASNAATSLYHSSTAPKPQKTSACCGGKDVQRKMTEATEIASEYQRVGSMPTRRNSVQFGSVHTRNYGNTPQHHGNSTQDLASQSFPGISAPRGTSTQELISQEVMSRHRSSTGGRSQPRYIVTSSTGALAPLTSGPSSTRGHQSARVQSRGALSRSSMKPLPPSGKPCPQCQGTGVVYDPATKTPRGYCNWCSSAHQVHEAPLSVYEASHDNSRSMQKIDRDGTTHMTLAPASHTHMTSSKNGIPSRATLTPTASSLQTQRQKGGCCARVDDDMSMSSSYCSTCDSCSCSECMATRSSLAAGARQDRDGTTSMIPVTDTNELRLNGSTTSGLDARRYSEGDRSVVSSAAPSSTSIHHYGETDKSERQRDLGYTVRKLFFNVDKSHKPGDNHPDADNSHYNLLPTYSVSYKNYPNICYDAIVPTKYGDFFRGRVAPIRQ